MTGRAMAARSDETGTGSAEGNSAVANGDGPQITGDNPMTDTTDQQAVTVAQEDRDAVQAFHRTMLDRLMSDVKSQRPKLGDDEGDAGTLVQAFARHRLASVSSASAEGESVTEFKNRVVRLLHDMFDECTHCDTEALAYQRAEKEVRALMLAASPEPVPATNQAGEVEV